MPPSLAGETGWDIFSLDYRVATPLDVVVTPAAMHRYLQVFSFLWRLKRVEHTLGEDWKRARMRSVRANAVITQAPAFRAVLHRCQMLRSEMFHFVSNLHSCAQPSQRTPFRVWRACLLHCVAHLQHAAYLLSLHSFSNNNRYMMFEVLETAWAACEAAMRVAVDLDQLLAAHDAYLSSIVEKVGGVGHAARDCCECSSCMLSLTRRAPALAQLLTNLSACLPACRHSCRSRRANFCTSSSAWSVRPPRAVAPRGVRS